MGHPQQRTLRLSGAMVSCAQCSRCAANDRKHQSLGHPPKEKSLEGAAKGAKSAGGIAGTVLSQALKSEEKKFNMIQRAKSIAQGLANLKQCNQNF
jgi:hypothetical protein